MYAVYSAIERQCPLPQEANPGVCARLRRCRSQVEPSSEGGSRAFCCYGWASRRCYVPWVTRRIALMAREWCSACARLTSLDFVPTFCTLFDVFGGARLSRGRAAAACACVPFWRHCVIDVLDVRGFPRRRAARRALTRRATCKRRLTSSRTGFSLITCWRRAAATLWPARKVNTF